jgi:eukaryotic-like serine/threonine-protein kinase
VTAPPPDDGIHEKPASLVEPPVVPAKQVIPPAEGEIITSEMTGNTYTMGQEIGEGHFGRVFSCADVWGNELAAKVMKPIGPYEKVKTSTEEEFRKLLLLRHPNITYLHDAWEFRDTFYLITERCSSSLAGLLASEWFDGRIWLRGIARCLLQAVHFIHINRYCHQDIHPGNVFTTFARDELASETPQEALVVQFKLGDLGVAKLFDEVDATNTRNLGMLPPEVLNSAEFGPLDYRMAIYHCGLLLLQVAHSREIRFTEDEITAGKPRQLALQLPRPLDFALEKALRRHVDSRTATAMEFWRDLSSPESIGASVPEQLMLQETVQPEDSGTTPNQLNDASGVPGDKTDETAI